MGSPLGRSALDSLRKILEARAERSEDEGAAVAVTVRLGFLRELYREIGDLREGLVSSLETVGRSGREALESAREIPGDAEAERTGELSGDQSAGGRSIGFRGATPAGEA